MDEDGCSSSEELNVFKNVRRFLLCSLGEVKCITCTMHRYYVLDTAIQTKNVLSEVPHYYNRFENSSYNSSCKQTFYHTDTITDFHDT